MRQKIKSSFRLQFSLTVVLVILIPVMVIMAFVVYRGYQSIETNAKDVLAHQSDSLSQSAASFEETAQLALDNMRRQPVIRSMNPELQEPTLINMADVYTSMYLALTTDLSGTSLARSDGEDPKEYGDLAWFREASAGVEGYQQSLVSRTTGEPTIIYSSPIEQDDEIVGVAFVGTELTTLAEVVGAIKIGDTGLGYLVDSNGFMIAHPDPFYSSDNLVYVGSYPPVFDGQNGTSGSYSFVDEDGIEWLADIRPVGNGWYAIVQQHRSEAMAALPSFIAIAVGLTLLGTAVIGFLAYVVAGQAVKPIEYLTAAATAVSAGHLDETVEVDRIDEIGTLASAFNSMTFQLRYLVGNLETRIAARTQDLNLAADIGRQVSQARNLGEVLDEATTSIKEQFNLYQVQIYLTDPRRENLILRASDGHVGSRLVVEGHQLLLDQHSINGSAAYNKKAVIVADTHENEMFRPHPLLPDTRSEMVVPLLIEDDILGVMDLQSTEANRLTEEVLPAFTVLAGQLAIAIINARQNRAIQENQRLMRTIIDATPDWIFVKDQDHRYQIVNQAFADSHHLSPEQIVGKNDIELGLPEELVKGNPEKGIRGFWTDDREIMDSGKTKETPEEPTEIDGEPLVLHTIKAPLMDADGNVTGIVGFVHDITNRKLAEATIAKRADELQAVAELSTAVAATTDPQQLLQEAVNLAKARFGLYHAHIYLMDEAKENLVLASGVGEAGRMLVEEGVSIPLGQEQSLVARAARTKEGVIVNDVMADPGFLPNPLLPETRSEMAVPMIAGNQVLGVFDVQADIAHRFSNEDIQIQMTLAAQTAVALQNARQFEQTQQALADTHIFRQLADASSQGIHLSTLQGKTLYANPTLLDLLHIENPETELYGKQISAFYPDEIQIRYQQEINQILLDFGFWQGELHLGEPEDLTITYENYFLLRDAAGNPTHIAAVITDITEQKETEEAIRANQTLMRTIIDATPNWIVVKDISHHYALVNQSFADSRQLSVAEIIGKNEIEIGYDEDMVKGNPEKGLRGFWTEDQELMNSGQTRTFDNETIEVNGETHYKSTAKIPLKDDQGNVTGLVIFTNDVTDQRKAQEEQTKLAQELAEQLAQVNALQRAMTREGWEAFLENTERGAKGFALIGETVQTFDDNTAAEALGNIPLNLNEITEVSYDEAHTTVMMPLQIHGESIGVIGARSVNGEPLNAEQQALLTTLTTQVAESLERARLFEETELARSQTEALFTGSESVVRATSLNDILQALIQATALKNRDQVSLLFFDQPWQTEQPETMTIGASWHNDGDPPQVPIGTTYPLAMYPITQFLDRDKPATFDDIATDPRLDVDEKTRTLFIDEFKMRSFITIPLVVGDQWLGYILGLSSSPHHMSASDIRQIISLAGQAATVAQSQRLYEEAESRAEREQILRQVSDRVYAAPDAETVLRTAVREIGQALGVDAFVYLDFEETDEMIQANEDHDE